MNTSDALVWNATFYKITDLSSDEASLFYLHVLLLDIVLLVMGVGGNLLVFYIYHWKLQRTLFTLLVRVLAILDFLSVSVNIPLGILFKFFFVHPNDYRLCSLYLFMEHFLFCCSGLLFIIIAVQRYRKMCKVFKDQLHLPLARKLLLGSFCLSIVASIPLLFSISGRYVEVPYGENFVLATTCDYTDKTKESGLSLVGAILFDMEFTVMTFVLAVLYFRISRKYKQHGTHARNLSFKKSMATRHMTKIFSLITVFFLVSMTPILVCSSVFSVTKEKQLKMSRVEFVFFDIGIILPYFHSIVNPVIYGATIRNFRQECRKLFQFVNCFGKMDTGLQNEANRDAVLLREST